MRFLISLLVFALGALGSPVVIENRVAYETVYTTVSYNTDFVVWVTTGPTVSATSPAPEVYQDYEVDLSTYRRHRHRPQNGSPKAAEYIPTTITVDSLVTSIPTETTTSVSEVAKSEELVVTSEVESSSLSSITPTVPASISLPISTPTAVSTSTLSSDTSLALASTSLTTPTSAVVSTSTSSSDTSSVLASTPLLTPALTVVSTSTSSFDTSSVLASTSLPISTTTVVFTSTSTSATLASTSSSSSSSIELTTTSISSSPATSSNVVDATTAQPPTTFVPNLDPASPVYQALVLQHHNVHRRNHSAPDLTWNAKIAGYAETTAKTCIWGHSSAPGGGGYGQNIAAGTPVGNISAILTNGFYNGELPHYPQFGTNNPDMSNFEEWGHFSQFVWHSTTSVGCYTAICTPPGVDSLSCKPDGTSYLKGLNCGNGGIPAIFTVCNYDPPGNYDGEYLNVGAPEGRRTVYVDGKGTEGL